MEKSPTNLPTLNLWAVGRPMEWGESFSMECQTCWNARCEIAVSRRQNRSSQKHRLLPRRKSIKKSVKPIQNERLKKIHSCCLVVVVCIGDPSCFIPCFNSFPLSQNHPAITPWRGFTKLCQHCFLLTETFGLQDAQEVFWEAFVAQCWSRRWYVRLHDVDFFHWNMSYQKFWSLMLQCLILLVKIGVWFRSQDCIYMSFDTRISQGLEGFFLFVFFFGGLHPLKINTELKVTQVFQENHRHQNLHAFLGSTC